MRTGQSELANRPQDLALPIELGASCAQDRRTVSRKSFLFNLCFENKRVRKIFGSGTMYGNVAPYAWSPPNFPHSETTAKLLRSGSRLSRRHKSVRANRVGGGLENLNLVFRAGQKWLPGIRRHAKRAILRRKVAREAVVFNLRKYFVGSNQDPATRVFFNNFRNPETIRICNAAVEICESCVQGLC